jgi:glycosyltransferase involved in cell wall biosynthesis
MALRMAQVARDEALQRDLAARGRVRAASFSWESAARDTLAIYWRVGGPAPVAA